MRRGGVAARATRPEPVAPGATALGAIGATVTVEDRAILRDASVAIRAGEVVALVGPNGAGKSTLVGVLAGDTEMASGAVELAGRPLGEWSGVDLALRRAVLPQQVTVTFPFSVREVVEMGRAPWVVLDGDDGGGAVIDDCLARCDVTHLGDRSYPTLSGGERSRAALARVLAQDTGVLLLDEPTAALDLHHQEMVLRLARERADAGVAVAVVLHDLGLAAAHADRIVVLDDGRVVVDGPPAEVLRPDLLSAVYRHPVEVFPHPRTGELMVLPVRADLP